MSHIILSSEILILIGTGFKIVYSRFPARKLKAVTSRYPVDKTADLLRLQSLYGYNEHSSVSISATRNVWFDEQTSSAVNYTEHGKVWLAAGEMLAADENLISATNRFLQAASRHKKIVAFLPTTEKFARLIADSSELKAVKIGASPYFALQNWNPRGNKAKKLRAGLSQARRSTIKVQEISEIKDCFRTEVDGLCRDWLKTRRSIIELGWLFKLSPFQNEENKRFFVARNDAGKLVGFLMASPIPARAGWYLEDVLRASDAPNGTADLLVFETMKILAAEGVQLVTLGTAPLATDGEDEVSSNGNYFTKHMLNVSRKHLNAFYNFRGLRHFKAKFVPTWWESEYVLIPRGVFAPLLVLLAFLLAIVREK
jgi:lysylphosphatidylglycerol synthetase-like protein (DUF2156 family)